MCVFKRLLPLPLCPDESCWQGVSALPDYKETFPKWRAQNMAALVPTLDPAGVDLLTRMLIYTPQHRITARAAMQVRGGVMGGRYVSRSCPLS